MQHGSARPLAVKYMTVHGRRQSDHGEPLSLRLRLMPGSLAAPDALKVALSGMNGMQLTSTDFTRATAENDSFVGWVQAMTQRFRDHMAATSGGAGGQG